MSKNYIPSRISAFKWCLLALLLPVSSCNFEDRVDQTAQIKDSCVRFLCIRKAEPKFVRVGSGFIVNDRGDLVTNNHVVAGAEIIFVFHRIKERTRLHVATPLKVMPEADLAVLSSGIKGTPLTLNLALPNPDISGNVIVSSVGFPAIADTSSEGLGNILLNKASRPELKSQGVDITQDMQDHTSLALFAAPSVAPPGGVRRIARRPLLQVDDNGQESQLQGRNVETVEFNVDIAPGNSGGPLLDKAGYVVGVVGQGRHDDVHQIQFAISSKELSAFLADHSVPFAKVELDVSKLPFFTPPQKAMVALAAAALLVGIGMLIFFALRSRNRPVTSMPTKVFEERIGIWMGKREQQMAPPAPEPPSGLSWELDISGPNGFSQQLTLTEADFIKGRGRIIVGRNADFCGLPLRHDSVSRQQMHFSHSNGSLTVADRNSSNGTKVGGVRLATPFKDQVLREGDRLEFGELSATLRRRF
ncbi:trypsin-like peptidase domain-containing protein [Prosthecobacter sp.]|uniref:trypsin-like peptidase domain-containing protein n=1 Tax=Prosthecobacter sp. TaxID=1965333 RepID=UPI003783DF95